MDTKKNKPRERTKVLRALKDYNLEQLDKLLKVVIVREQEQKEVA